MSDSPLFDERKRQNQLGMEHTAGAPIANYKVGRIPRGRIPGASRSVSIAACNGRFITRSTSILGGANGHYGTIYEEYATEADARAFAERFTQL